MRKTVSYCVISLVLVSALTLGGCIMKPKKVEIPNLIGIELESAIESLELVSLNPDALKGEAAPEKDLEDIVYWQAPDAGTKVKKNSIVTFTFYDEYIFVRPQRVISMLWMGDENWVKEMAGISLSAQKSMIQEIGVEWSQGGFGGTHIVGFHEPCRPDWYEGYDVKLVSYLKYYDPPQIREYARRWKDHPNHGGFWMIEGHEPDITGGNAADPGSIERHKALRREQYLAIREEDPDKWNHPVVIFYDMTSCEEWDYPGWEKAFPLPEEGVDCDIFIIDCYPGRDDGTIDYPGMEAGGRLVEIGLARSQGQFIPNLDACMPPGATPASIVDQWEWWKRWYQEKEGNELRGVCYWNSGIGSAHIGVYENEYFMEEVRKINRSLGLLGD